MGIYIEQVRIKNFRSIKSLDLKMSRLNIIIGHNNCGKSNFLCAIECGLKNHYDVEEDDIFCTKVDNKSKSSKAIIDLKIVPDDKEFDDSWSTWFCDNWISLDLNKEFVGIRTEIVYDVLTDHYHTVKKPINSWGNSIDESKVGKPTAYRSEMLDYLNSFYVDASRDFTLEMKDKKSYFNRSTKNINLGDDVRQQIERELSSLNAKIIDSIDEIKETNCILSEIAPVIGIEKESVNISPLARRVDDLNKGLDVFIAEENLMPFSITNYGMGTKSWISLLSLKAYVNFVNKKLKMANKDNSDAYFMLLLEEPEAHLHPQAQKQLYSQLKEFSNQKIISSHSPGIVSNCEPSDIIYFYKENGETKAKRFNSELFDENEIAKIKREILRSKGELLFSNYVILCEGLTEEQELPIYFEKKYGVSPNYYGISIVGVGGVNYSIFKKLFEMFSIKYIIVSDGEANTLNTLKNTFGLDDISQIGLLGNVFYYPNNDDIERYLIREGFSAEIRIAINLVEKKDYSYLIQCNPEKLTKEIKSNKICPTCKQHIIETEPVDTFGLCEDDYILYKFITRKKHKAKYSEQIALVISENSIPNIFSEAFDKIINNKN